MGVTKENILLYSQYRSLHLLDNRSSPQKKEYIKMEGLAIYFRKNNLSSPSDLVSYAYSQNIHSFNNNSIIVFSLFSFIPAYVTCSLRNMDLQTQVCSLLKNSYSFVPLLVYVIIYLFYSLHDLKI